MSGRKVQERIENCSENYSLHILSRIHSTLTDIPEYAAACQTNNVLRHLEKKEIADVLQGKLFKEKVATLIGADYIFPFIEYDDGVQGIVDICIMNKE